MPRKARIKSITSIYHIVIRGIDRQIIFETQKDYRKYIDLLEFYKEECHFEILAYCLMSNHVHLIIRTTDISLETIFRRLNTKYALWFNMKYQRSGHLQENRYYSEPIEDDKYLLTSIRYVHNNPMKAGLESSPGMSYKWSSIFEYTRKKSHIVNTSFVLNIISLQDFLSFSALPNDDTCMDIDSIKKRIPDDVAKDIIFKISGCSTSTSFQNLSVINQYTYIREIHNNGVSIRQLNRLTGFSKGHICTILKN